jgi:DNA-binding transcriptional LysR family regulator
MPGGREVSVDALREFAVFAEQLNFTRAARELHISQPALHVKVRKLAERVGRPLYRREGRHLVLTPDGEALGRFGREVEERLHGLLAELGGAAPAPVVLAAGEGAHLYVLAPGVQRLLASGARLRLLSTDAPGAIAAVSSARADLAVAVVGSVPDGLDRVVVASYPQVAALPADHPLARRRALTLGDLDAEPLVLPPPRRPLRTTLDRALRAAGVRASVAVEAEGWQAMMRFVALGMGIAVVNGCVPACEGAVTRPLTDLPEVTYSALHQPGALDDSRVATVLDTLRAAAP